MWQLTAWAKTRAGVTGVPWRDLTDEEFEEVSAQFEPGALLPYFEHVAAGEAVEPAAVEPEPEPDQPEPAPAPDPEPAMRVRRQGARRGDR